MAESNGNGNGSKLWPIVACAIAAWSFLIEPYVDRTEDLKFAIENVARIGKEHVEMRYADNRRDIDRIDDRLTRMVEAEQTRNNRIEARLAAEESVTELFKGGKLLMNGARP